MLSERGTVKIKSSKEVAFLLVTLAFLLTLGIASWHQAHLEWRQWQIRYNSLHPRATIPLKVRVIVPTLTGKPELCPTCHVGLSEISPSHPVAVFGCTIFHGGNGQSLNRARAHAGLLGGRNPSDFSVVRQTCGRTGCHAGFDVRHADRNQVDRVMRHLMTTYAGGIAYVRFSFGAQPDLRGRYGVLPARDPNPPPGFVSELQVLPVSQPGDLTPALKAAGVTVSGQPIDTRMRTSCLQGGCHLSEPAARKPYRYRSTGCAACHVLYANDGLYRGDDPTISHKQPGHGIHHRLTTAIPFSQCNHCHNRGNYSLRRMRFVSRPDLPPAGPSLSEFTPPRARRLIEYYQPIGQFTRCEWELDCIDCHTSEEVMGNGHIPDAIKDVQVTECRTCHGTIQSPPSTALITSEEEPAMRQARLNPFADVHVGDRVVVTRTGEKLWAIKEVSPGHFVETLKVTGQRLDVPLAYGSACLQKPDQQAARYCHRCHAFDRDRVLKQWGIRR